MKHELQMEGRGSCSVRRPVKLILRSLDPQREIQTPVILPAQICKLVDAAVQAGVSRFVLVSSLLTNASQDDPSYRCTDRILPVHITSVNLSTPKEIPNE